MSAPAWGVLLTALLVGWVVLDGAVQGVGASLLRPGRTREERRLLLAAVGPLLLPGEVWLIAAAGVLLGAFPHAESELAAAGYPAVVALIASWAVRDAGFWLRSRRTSVAWRRRWDRAIVVSSTLLSASFGALLGVAWGNAAAAVGLAVVAIVLTGVHGRAVAARRLGMTARLPLWLTSGAVAAPVVVTVAVAWPHLMDGAVSQEALHGLGIMILAALPALLLAQGAAWWMVARRLGPKDVVFF